MPFGSVALMKVTSGSSFGEIQEKYFYDDQYFYRIKVDKFNGKSIKTLNDLENASKQALDMKFTILEYINFMLHNPSFNVYNGFKTNHGKLIQDIKFDNSDYSPVIYKFDNSKHEWQIVK